MATAMKRLEGRVALVTGGASGIGAAAVRQFVGEGARVTFTDLNLAGGEALAQELGEACRFVPGDHTIEAHNQAAVNVALQAFGQLDILYNNAGMILQGNIGDTQAARIEQLLRVNLLGPFLMVQAALPALHARAATRQCAILFTASVQSLIARPGYTAYGASKHGLGGLVGSLALELAPGNIRVNAVCPGPVDTPLFRDGTRHISSDPSEVENKYMSGVPMGRFITPQEIAQAACFLVSDQASAITGAMLPVDGGITAR